ALADQGAAGRPEHDGGAHHRDRGAAGGASGAGHASSSTVIEKGSVDFHVERCSTPFAGANRSRFEGLRSAALSALGGAPLSSATHATPGLGQERAKVTWLTWVDGGPAEPFHDPVTRSRWPWARSQRS